MSRSIQRTFANIQALALVMMAHRDENYLLYDVPEQGV